MAHPVSISVQSVRMVCNTLESLLAKSFGPNALQVLYTTSSGKVLLTSDGSTILHALHMSHPIGRWLTDRVITFHTQTGDHSKSFVMLVADILRCLSQELSHSASGLDREQIINLCKGLSFVLQEIFPVKVLPALLDRSEYITHETPDQTVFAIGQNLILTHLAGKLSPKIARFMSRMLWDFFTGYVGKPVHILQNGTDLLYNLWDKFAETSWEVVGLPIESSHIEEGVILSRYPVHLPERSTDLSRRFIIFGFDPCKISVTSSATISATTTEDLIYNMRYTHLIIVKIVDTLMRFNVGVLLCTECLPITFLSLLQQASIAVIHTIPIEELQRLSSVANVEILYELPEELDSSVTSLVQEVKQVTFGNKRGTQLVLGKGITGAKHVVLCAPSEGMCRTLSQAARGAIKCIHTWLEASINPGRCQGEKRQSPSNVENISNTAVRNERREAPLQDQKEACIGCGEQSGSTRETRSEPFGWVISGGGAAELITSDTLNRELTRQKDNWNYSTALKIISSALLGIPRRIYQQSFAAKSNESHSFMKIVKQAHSTLGPLCQNALGLNGRTGELCVPADIGVIESLSGKYCLWLSVVETVVELLNMDQIVPVQKCIIDKRRMGDDEDDE